MFDSRIKITNEDKILVYIYKEWISDDEELIQDKIFDLLCCEIQDIGRVENQMEYEDVELEECTIADIRHYVNNGYEYIGKLDLEEE